MDCNNGIRCGLAHKLELGIGPGFIGAETQSFGESVSIVRVLTRRGD